MNDIDILAQRFSAAEIGRRIGASRHQVASWIQHTRPVPQKYHAALHELVVRLGLGAPPVIDARPNPGGGFAVDDARDRSLERLIREARREYQEKLRVFGDGFLTRQKLVDLAREVYFKTGVQVDPRRIAGMSEDEIRRRDAFAEYQRRAAAERAAEVEAAGGWLRWLFGLGPPRRRLALLGPGGRKQAPAVDTGQAALAEAAAEIAAAAYYGAPMPAPQSRPAAAQARAGTPCIYCGQRAVIFLWDGPRCGAHVMS